MLQIHILKTNQISKKGLKASSEQGFTLIEMLAAILILTIGLLGLMSAITYSLTMRNMSYKVTDAKLIITSTLEQTENLRNSKHLTFEQIGNEGQISNDGAPRVFNGFPAAFRTISTDPGVDGIYGTTDDPVATLRPSYTRRIVITALPVGANILTCNLKRVEVTVRFPGETGAMQQLVGIGYINNDAHGVYIP